MLGAASLEPLAVRRGRAFTDGADRRQLSLVGENRHQHTKLQPAQWLDEVRRRLIGSVLPRLTWLLHLGSQPRGGSAVGPEHGDRAEGSYPIFVFTNFSR